MTSLECLMYNLMFHKQGSQVSLPPEAQQFVDALKANPAVEAVFNDAIVGIEQQVLPNNQNRVDADLSALQNQVTVMVRLTPT